MSQERVRELSISSIKNEMLAKLIFKIQLEILHKKSENNES